MTDKRVWVMLNGGVGVYSVLAESEEDARRQIEKELGGKAGKAFILRKWQDEDRPVREQKTKAVGGKKR